MSKNAKFYSLLCVGLFSALTFTKAQNLDAEIQRLEKQKKILELKRQNNQLQKELDRSNAPSNYQNNTPSNYQGNYPAQPKTKQNSPKGNQPQYYAPPAQGAAPSAKQSKKYYYEEEEDDDEVVYTSKKDTQFYIRLEGGAYIGLHLWIVPQTSLELGFKYGDSTRFFLGASYAWAKGNQFIVDGYLGLGWIPKLFDSPVRYVLDAYIGGNYGEYDYDYEVSAKSYVSGNQGLYVGYSQKYKGRTSGAGFLAGIKTGLAFDIGKHTWLEFGTRVEASIGSLYNLVVTPYGSFSILF